MEIVYNAKSFSRSSDGGWNNKNHFERLLQITSTIKSGFCIIKTWVGVEIPKSANVALPFWPILWALYDRNLQLQTCTRLPRQISSDYDSCGQSVAACQLDVPRAPCISSLVHLVPRHNITEISNLFLLYCNAGFFQMQTRQICRHRASFSLVSV